MTRRNFLALSAFASLAAGCGGGGGSDKKATFVTGIVYDSLQADLPIEGATVTIGGASAVTTARAQASSSNQVGSFRITGDLIGASTATIVVPGKDPQTLAFLPAVAAGTNPELALYLNIGQVRGRVVDELGKAVKSAFVVVNTPQGSLSSFSNTDGTFLIDLVPDGPAEISAGSGSKIATKNLTISFGINDTGDLTLQPDPNPNPPPVLKTISGKLTSALDASAIVNAPVFLLRAGVQVETINTDASGEYFFIVPAGSFSVQAFPGGYISETKPAELVNPNNPLVINFNLTPR